METAATASNAGDAPIEEGAARGAERIPASRTTRGRRVLVIVSAVALLLLAAVVRAVRQGDRRPASAAIVDGHLQVSDRQGRVLWQVVFPEGDAAIPQPTVRLARVGGFWISNTHIIEDLDSDGATEVLFVLDRMRSTGIPIGNRIICFDADGKERWRFTPGRRVSWGGRSFNGEYFVAWVVGPFPVAGRPTLAVGAQNAFFPFQISLLDAGTGRLTGEYWHLGGFSAVLITDWDRDGEYEILAGGVNNPGPGPGLPALVRLRASSLRLLAPDAKPFEQSTGSESDYLLFPPLNGLERDDVPRRIAWITPGDGGEMQVGVSFGPRFEDRGQVYYTLNGDLQVLDARPCDLLRAYRRRLLDEGHLTRSLTDEEVATWRDVRRFPRMPNANRPEIRTLWPPAYRQRATGKR
jgi:hypothetical protein